MSPFPVLLHNYKSGSLESGLRLCRFVKDPAMWAVLSGMAAEARDLNIAEAAYAAINEVCTLLYVTLDLSCISWGV